MILIENKDDTYQDIELKGKVTVGPRYWTVPI